MGFVLYYLVRVEPFASYHTALLSGRFDHADRLFHSLPRSVVGVGVGVGLEVGGELGF